MTEPVVTLYARNFRDAAAALRAIVEELENGCYGQVETVAVAIHRSDEDVDDRVLIFGAGPQSDSDRVALVFAAAAQEARRIILHGTPERNSDGAA